METLSQSALLTLSSHVHVDIAAAAVLALVDGIFRDTSPEEAFAPLTRQRVVVVSRGAIATNQTQFFLLLRARIWRSFFAEIPTDSAIWTVVAVDSIAR
jgi:hypothetical protein